MSDDLKNYFVFQYIYDPVAEGFTAIEGELMGYVQATDAFDAMEKLGFNDPNQYFARIVEDFPAHQKKMVDEIEKIKKLQKQFKPIYDGAKEDSNKCPNCGGQLDNERNCPDCTFGHEDQGSDQESEEMKDVLKGAGIDTSKIGKVTAIKPTKAVKQPAKKAPKKKTK